MVVKKVACICLPSQTVFDPAMLTDIETSQPQTISPKVGSLDSRMHPGSLRQGCFILAGAYQKLGFSRGIEGTTLHTGDRPSDW